MYFDWYCVWIIQSNFYTTSNKMAAEFILYLVSPFKSWITQLIVRSTKSLCTTGGNLVIIFYIIWSIDRTRNHREYITWDSDHPSLIMNKGKTTADTFISEIFLLSLLYPHSQHSGGVLQLCGPPSKLPDHHAITTSQQLIVKVEK